MPAPTGKRLERLVAAIHHAESTGAAVTWNDTIDGRQFDVTVRFKLGLHSYLTVIECKDYSSKVSVEKIDALVTKARDVKANKAVMVSSRGFQSGCFPVAERHGVQLLVLTETSTTSVEDLVAKITPALNIFEVSFQTPARGKVIAFEDWGGRLNYLMNHSRLIAPAINKAPNEIVYDWLTTDISIELGSQNAVEMPLPDGTELHIPNEEPTPVETMRFKCSLVSVRASEVPIFDTHLTASLYTRVELRDEKGVLRHTARLSDIPLGFDSEIVAGRFYEIPDLFIRCYCEKIEGDLITWIVVENYQHGHLFQATITQKIKHAKHYVEVTDAKVLQRLSAMLAKLKERYSNPKPVA